MSRLSTALFLLLATASLSSCSPESFKVEACELGNTIGFKIFPVTSWFRDYQPRPYELIVIFEDKQGNGNDVLWKAGLRSEHYDERAPRKVIAYGQQLPGWEVQQPSKPLSREVRYSVKISDGRYAGWTEFEIGKPLPAC